MSDSMFNNDRSAHAGEDPAQQALADDGGVQVVVKQIGPNQHSIVATTTLDQPVGRIWAVFCDFEKLVATALPGVASDFQWLMGGSPDRVPSRLQFVASGVNIVEEIYRRDDAEYVLRYRVLEPALGILEYDSVLQLTPISDEQTIYTSTRTATLEPGAVDGLAGLIALETQNLKSHFAKQS
jgi:hypothetical protein